MLVLKKEESRAIRANGRPFIGVVGEPKTGKTRLLGAATELSRFKKMVYVATDSRSEGLGSILEEHRDNLTVVMPGFRPLDSGPVQKWEQVVYDPALGKEVIQTDYIEDIVRTVTRDWASEGYDILAIDTGSEVAERMLWQVTQKGEAEKYGQKRLVVDLSTRPSAADIPPQYRKVSGSNQPDYGLAQRMFVDDFMLPLVRQRVTTVVTFHMQVDDKTGHAGPMTVGSKMLARIPKYFDFLVATALDKNGNYIMHTKPWKVMGTFHMPAGIREGRQTEVFKDEVFRLGSPSPVNFWEKVCELVEEQNATA